MALSTYYARIYPALMDLPQGRRIIEEGIQRLKSVKLIRHSFEVTLDKKSSKLRATPKWDFSFGQRNSRDIVHCYRITRATILEHDFIEGKEFIKLPWNRIFPDMDFHELATTHFGATVKTSNCRLNTVLGKNTESNVLSLSNWTVEVLRGSPHHGHIKHSPITHHERRTKQQMQAMLRKVAQSPEYDEAKQNAFIDFAAIRVKNVMLKYSYLGDEVIERGLKLFQCADVMSK